MIIMEYRNTLQIMSSVLETAQSNGIEGVRVTELIQKSNLSHKRLKSHMSKLLGRGLINEIVVKKHQVFVLTEKGMLYLEEYKKFDDMAKSFGLEL